MSRYGSYAVLLCACIKVLVFFFFFSSRRRHTRFDCDWSSDVCSSDLLNGGAFLGVEVDGEKIKRRIRTGYCDICVNDLDEAVRILKNSIRQRQAVSEIGRASCRERV